MPVPAVPRARLVVIETELVLGSLEAVLDGPAMAFGQNQLFHSRALGAPGGEEGKIVIIGDAAADQEASCPFPGESAVVFAGVEIGQFEIGPIAQARAFGAIT